MKGHPDATELEIVELAQTPGDTTITQYAVVPRDGVSAPMVMDMTVAEDQGLLYATTLNHVWAIDLTDPTDVSLVCETNAARMHPCTALDAQGRLYYSEDKDIWYLP